MRSAFPLWFVALVVTLGVVVLPPYALVEALRGHWSPARCRPLEALEMFLLHRD